MAFWGFGRKEEKRSSLENPRVPISSNSILELFDVSKSSAGVAVTVETALGVPAVWAAVNFISGTLAGLPLHVYSKTKQGREKLTGGLQNVLHDAVNDGMSSFEWRKSLFEQALTKGRGLSYIERNVGGKVVNLWPINPDNVTVERRGFEKFYIVDDGTGKSKTYAASEIIDIPFMLQSDGLGVYSPIKKCADAIGLAIAATNYGARFLANGGVPPFAIVGNFQSGGALKTAQTEFDAAVKKAAKENKQALVLPFNMDIKSIGGDPDKSQLVELQRFSVEQIARIYSIPPTFLQDLTHGTMSNTEQQDLHFVKHTMKRWIEQFEQELNLKLFGRANNRQYVELNLDGLLRGDFATRMEGYSKGIQNAILTPAEIREKENMPMIEGSDQLLIQGATVPLGSQPQMQQPIGVQNG